MNYYLDVLKKYATFSGRARRKEYWMFILFNSLALIILAILDGMLGLSSRQTGLGVLSGIYYLATLLPSFAVLVRRLHDTDRSAWWLLLFLIPLVGPIVVLIFTCLDSKTGENKYGTYPKA